MSVRVPKRKTLGLDQSTEYVEVKHIKGRKPEMGIRVRLREVDFA